ncbi:MAG: winged helix-turn-helix domain-containing protein [Gemmatimonadota bacterium]
MPSRSIQFLDLEGLEGTSTQSLNVRVQGLIRRAILARNFAAGARRPASRVLAADLKVSRHTVEHALDQLVAEGFLVRPRGSGSYTASGIPKRE